MKVILAIDDNAVVERKKLKLFFEKFNKVFEIKCKSCGRTKELTVEEFNSVFTEDKYCIYCRCGRECDILFGIRG